MAAVNAGATPFVERIERAVREKCSGSIHRAALEIGIEYTTLWYFLRGRKGLALRSFALMCTWAGINPNDVIEEFSK